jgi:hypothetical protein
MLLPLMLASRICTIIHLLTNPTELNLHPMPVFVAYMSREIALRISTRELSVASHARRGRALALGCGRECH